MCLRAKASIIKRAVAKALLPLLNQELEHIQTPPIISRPRESDVRATCGTLLNFSTMLHHQFILLYRHLYDFAILCKLHVSLVWPGGVRGMLRSHLISHQAAAGCDACRY
jgi:hypothetical protein